MPIVRDVFCPVEQRVTPHFVSVDKSTRELIMKCPSPCEHFIKFPTTVTPTDVNEFLPKYEASNRGQVKAVEEISDEHEQEILNAFSNPST